MAWSKSTRISIMLAIDVAFFFLELTIGFVVHSLALTADAFHMLNDIISLLVGLWAVHLAQKQTTDKFSYGWLRAEILGAFFNAVFLIALCVSIMLEALSRFVDPPEISNPKLILIVGSLGLASNLVGFFVLGGHGHSHGGGGEEHSHSTKEAHNDVHEAAHDDISAAEQGRAGGNATTGSTVGDENGRPADVLLDATVARLSTIASSKASTRHIAFDDDDAQVDKSNGKSKDKSDNKPRKRASSSRRNGLNSIDNLSIHPASFRQDIIQSARTPVDESTDESGSGTEATDDEQETSEGSALVSNEQLNRKGPAGYGTNGRSSSKHGRRDSSLHGEHNHSKPKKTGAKGHGHSHSDMGMNAMILHVIGDALGNVGVIVTALIIWLTDLPGKYYADPAVSLFITVIILRSAIPLTLATSKILLQATPEGIEVKELKEDIESLPGVLSCHHIHIWQLSDTKIVASMHIHVSFMISEAGGREYMDLSRRVRKCLHAYGVHSATIQPEFCLDKTHNHLDTAVLGAPESGLTDATNRDEHPCSLECVDDCDVKGCCASDGAAGAGSGHSDAGHSQDGHDHEH